MQRHNLENHNQSNYFLKLQNISCQIETIY